jgi:DHA1 family inner membrane transport protein
MKPALPPILWLLAACNLVIGTGAFGLTGILVPMAASLGTSVAAAGQSMTAYALATALLAPLLLLATGRWSRRSTLQLALALFAAGTLVCGLAPSLPVLLAGRVLMGAGALLTPAAAGIVVALVPPSRHGQALSLVFLGMSLSYVVGLPLAAWLGQLAGWRVPVLGVTALTLAMLVAVSLRVPHAVNAPGARFEGLGAALRLGVVRRTLALTLLYFTAIFAVFGYIGPVLQALNPMDSGTLSLTLAVFGMAGVAGTLSGGWANDRFGPQAALRVQLSGLALMMLLVPLTRGHHAAMVAVFVVWGVCGFGMMTPQQSRLAATAPAQAPMLMSLNASMLYFGTALGAAVGGAGSTVLGFAHLPWLAAGFALAGLATLRPGADNGVHDRPHRT